MTARLRLSFRRSIIGLALVGLVTLGGLGLAATATEAAVAAEDGEQFATVEIELLGALADGDGRVADARVTVEARRALSGTLTVVDRPPGRAETTSIPESSA